MDVEVLEIKVNASRIRIAFLLIRYCELLLRCDLVYHPKDQIAWIRMPEIWNEGQKKCFCYWPSKETSNMFQKEVLKQIFDKYAIDLEKIKTLHRSKTY